MLTVYKVFCMMFRMVDVYLKILYQFPEVKKGLTFIQTEVKLNEKPTGQL